MTAFATEGGTTKIGFYICRKKPVENLDVKHVEWNGKVQNLKKEKNPNPTK